MTTKAQSRMSQTDSFGKFMETLFEDLSTFLQEKKEEVVAARAKNISALVAKSLDKTHIDIRGVGLTDAELIELVLPVLTGSAAGKWEGLDLRWNALSPLCAKQFVQAINKLTANGKKIKVLLLDNNALCDSGVEDLLQGFSSASLANLEVLSLSSNRITARGAEQMAKMLSHSHLKILALGGNLISDAGLEALAKALPDSSLESLAVPQSQITSRGMQALAEAIPRARRLADLDVSLNPDLSDKGAIALATSAPQSRLRRLNLAACNLTEKGLKRFISALKISDLHYLDLSGNTSTPELTRRMRDILEIKTSKWFQTVQALLSARQVSRLGRRSKFSVLPKELVREIANALPRAGITPTPIPPMFVINFFVALPEEATAEQR